MAKQQQACARACLLEDAAKGCVFGALLGDAVGTYYEFDTHDRITNKGIKEALSLNGGGPFNTGQAQYTDDGELTVSSLKALAEIGSDQPFKVDAHAYWYRQWMRSSPFDIGNTTRTGLEPLLRDNGPTAAFKCFEQVRRLNQNSESNGALMRATPLAIYGHKLLPAHPEDFARLVSFDVLFTHSNELVHAIVIAYTVAIATMLNQDALGDRERGLQAAHDWLQLHASDPDKKLVRTARGRVTLCEYFEQFILNKCPADDQDLANGHALGCRVDDNSMGWLVHAFTLAFRHLRRGTKWRDAIESTVRLGGDTDTNACIVGGLIGCAEGLKSLDKDMVKKLRKMDPSKFNSSSGSRGRCRPEHFAGKHLESCIDAVLQNAPSKLKLGFQEEDLVKIWIEGSFGHFYDADLKQTAEVVAKEQKSDDGEAKQEETQATTDNVDNKCNAEENRTQDETQSSVSAAAAETSTGGDACHVEPIDQTQEPGGEASKVTTVAENLALTTNTETDEATCTGDTDNKPEKLSPTRKQTMSPADKVNNSGTAAEDGVTQSTKQEEVAANVAQTSLKSESISTHKPTKAVEATDGDLIPQDKSKFMDAQ